MDADPNSSPQLRFKNLVDGPHPAWVTDDMNVVKECKKLHGCPQPAFDRFQSTVLPQSPCSPPVGCCELCRGCPDEKQDSGPTFAPGNGVVRTTTVYWRHCRFKIFLAQLLQNVSDAFAPLSCSWCTGKAKSCLELCDTIWNSASCQHPSASRKRLKPSLQLITAHKPSLSLYNNSLGGNMNAFHVPCRASSGDQTQSLAK